jgi:hypothetical protein
MNPTTRTPEELVWLKKVWLLANTNFELTISPGFEAHREELQAFADKWTAYYQGWKADPIFELSKICFDGDQEFRPYEEAIELIAESQSHEWKLRSMERAIKSANELGMSPAKARDFEFMKNQLDELSDKVDQMWHQQP